MRLMKRKAVVFTYTGSSFAPKFSVSAGKTVKLLWGDGQATIINGPVTSITYTHNYAASRTYQFRIIGDLDGVTKFQYMYSEELSGNIYTLKYLTSLADLRVSYTHLSGSLSSLIDLPLRVLYIDHTLILGSTTDLLIATLAFLDISYSFVAGDLADLSVLSLLVFLKVNNSSVNTYTQGVLPNWDACNIYISNLGLSQQEVDDFLCDLNTASTASVKLLEIHGTNAVPSAVGLACVNDDPDGLRAKGWTVTLST